MQGSLGQACTEKTINKNQYPPKFLKPTRKEKPKTKIYIVRALYSAEDFTDAERAAGVKRPGSPRPHKPNKRIFPTEESAIACAIQYSDRGWRTVIILSDTANPSSLRSEEIGGTGKIIYDSQPPQTETVTATLPLALARRLRASGKTLEQILREALDH